MSTSNVHASEDLKSLDRLIQNLEAQYTAFEQEIASLESAYEALKAAECLSVEALEEKLREIEALAHKQLSFALKQNACAKSITERATRSETEQNALFCHLIDACNHTQNLSSREAILTPEELVEEANQYIRLRDSARKIANEIACPMLLKEVNLLFRNYKIALEPMAQKGYELHKGALPAPIYQYSDRLSKTPFANKLVRSLERRKP